MGKSPGFWFFVGDWMKDPELRFCSLFARGLLVDLLCLMFEAKERGYLSKPNGEPRSDLDIINAISGGTCDEKMEALRELEASGVLSRDENGVLFSRRIARLGEVSKERSKAGSKGASKRSTKGEAKREQNDKQNTGVSDSDSVSVTTPPKVPQGESAGEILIPEKIKTKRFVELLEKWKSVIALESYNGKTANPISLQTTVERLSEFSERKACGYIAAWIDKRRIFTDWKADWESYQPPELVPKSSDEEQYQPKIKPTPKKVLVNG
jgi:hypothetical protein